jgi:hypothetical protein
MRPIFYPKNVSLAFPDGFQPVHLKCYRTARKVQQLNGMPVIAGIAFLDKHDKLFPWPHMVNAIGSTLADGLIDASPTVSEPNLGFAPVFLNETVAWNAITAAYAELPVEMATSPSWGDPNADKLTRLFLETLRRRASVARQVSVAAAIPDSLPEL